MHKITPLTGYNQTKRRLGLNERLGLIGLIDERMRLGSSKSPEVSDLFNNLWDLVNATVSGSKINRLKPEDSQNGFHVFEINAETGENLGHLNMLYLKKPIPCYYLVYVEVAAPYRRKGLGNRILEYFKDFLIKKSAMGILDNIIPEDDPTFSIYLKQAWEPIEAIIGDTVPDTCENYMIYIPRRLQNKALREPVLKLVHHIKRKRAAMNMRDNELMVQRTIAEFRELYTALLMYFEDEIRDGESSPLMRFMFTRFVTKLIAFRRRIGELLGYTGGDSLEQIILAPEISSLSVQTYVPGDSARSPSLLIGDKKLWSRLPENLKENPTRSIESLPNYRRPTLAIWLEQKGINSSHTLTIGDLMDLGFDPTRLKEITLDGEAFIFERIQARQLPDLEKKRKLLEHVELKMSGATARNARLRINPPLLVIRDRGNAYVLRRKIDGIHWEEAMDQLQSSPRLKSMNVSINCDRVILGTVREAKEMIGEALGTGEGPFLDLLTFFVSWDLGPNHPKLVIDFPATFLESVWMA
ncbi:MAG: hypothetical protein H8D67_28770 [Deltaproteobacteria bacterium]|nr:hypothetical protein [Deltaproteobacteria bacterium]